MSIGDRRTRICGGAKIKCYKEAEKIFSTNTNSKSIRSKCNCLPACTSIEYNVNIDRVTTNDENQLNPSFRMTMLSIFFEDYQMKTVKRNEVHTFTDFLAICGGVLGLFLGISALSIIELVYYTTLRLFWNIRREKYENIVLLSEQKGIKIIPIELIRFMQRIQTFCTELCKNSNIHGVRYFTEKKLHWSERLV